MINLNHYTNYNAVEGILAENPEENKEICLRATRYDGCEDKSEYKYGINCLGKHLTYLEKNIWKLPEDRHIGDKFKSKNVIGNINLPVPYVISFTTLNNNAYMWRN